MTESKTIGYVKGFEGNEEFALGEADIQEGENKGELKIDSYILQTFTGKEYIQPDGRKNIYEHEYHTNPEFPNLLLRVYRGFDCLTKPHAYLDFKDGREILDLRRPNYYEIAKKVPILSKGSDEVAKLLKLAIAHENKQPDTEINQLQLTELEEQLVEPIKALY